MDKFKTKPIPKQFPGILFQVSSEKKEEFDYDAFMRSFHYTSTADDVPSSSVVPSSVQKPDITSFTVTKLGYVTIEERIRAVKRIEKCNDAPIPTSEELYVLQNKKKFLHFIQNVLKVYVPDKAKSCDDLKDNTTLEPLPHQLLVQRYMNSETPYRGLLLYHGLGSGKTCSSILISEALKPYMKVVVMTPASLESNYLQELKKCGDKTYSLFQHWEWTTTPTEEDLATRCLTQSDLLKRNREKGLWKSSDKKPNYDDLSSSDQALITEQIDLMISKRYIMIRYNGVTESSFNSTYMPDGKNIFDNKLVIIDEAHNLVSRIINKLKDAKHSSSKLYNLLLGAENCKIVLLTGTPIINYSHEMAVLFNILRGNITAWSCVGVGESELIKQFSEIDVIYRKSDTFIVTQIPSGFSKVGHRVKRSNVHVDDFEQRLQEFVTKQGGTVERTVHKAFPDSSGEFTERFIKQGKLKDTSILQNRISGLISYFPDLEGLMPRLKETVFHRIEMSTMQLNEYSDVREQEISRERGARRKEDDEVKSSYRIESRQRCHTIYPESVRKLRPGENYEEMTEETEGIVQNLPGLSSFFKELDKSDYIEKLDIYSPKYNAMFQQILSLRGKQLIYSQFVTMEGIAVFAKVLNAKGFAEFKLKKGAEWDIDVSPAMLKRPMYVTYIGTKSMEEKELIRNIFNKRWEIIPEKLRDKVKDLDISVFVITAAGAEGISLKNVQYVHIMEPYWNQVRLDQVIGRARRICSHNTLPPKEQFVEVHMYIMVFPPKIPENLERDEIDGKPRTTDEYLHMLSLRKKEINTEIMECIKRASIDYFLYHASIAKNIADESIVSYHPDINDDETDAQLELNRGTTKTVKYLKNGPIKIAWVGDKADADGLIPMYRATTDELCGYTNQKGLFDLNKKKIKQEDFFAKFA